MWLIRLFFDIVRITLNLHNFDKNSWSQFHQCWHHLVRLNFSQRSKNMGLVFPTSTLLTREVRLRVKPFDRARTVIVFIAPQRNIYETWCFQTVSENRTVVGPKFWRCDCTIIASPHRHFCSINNWLHSLAIGWCPQPIWGEAPTDNSWPKFWIKAALWGSATPLWGGRRWHTQAVGATMGVAAAMRLPLHSHWCWHCNFADHKPRKAFFPLSSLLHRVPVWACGKPCCQHNIAESWREEEII